MKAVILAAGIGKRMLPLTLKVPKPMVRVHGVPILEHILTTLPKEILEIILVTGYLENQIKKYFGKNFLGKPIQYITQEKAQGTWKALKLTEKFLKKSDESFLLLFADDMHGRKGLQNLIKHKNSILVSQHDNPKKFGVVEKDENGYLINIEEKPENPKTSLVATGVYVLESKILDYSDPQIQNGEYFLTNVFNVYIKENKIKVVQASAWLPLGTPEDVLSAHTHPIFD